MLIFHFSATLSAFTLCFLFSRCGRKIERSTASVTLSHIISVNRSQLLPMTVNSCFADLSISFDRAFLCLCFPPFSLKHKKKKEVLTSLCRITNDLAPAAQKHRTALKNVNHYGIKQIIRSIYNDRTLSMERISSFGIIKTSTGTTQTYSTDKVSFLHENKSQEISVLYETTVIYEERPLSWERDNGSLLAPKCGKRSHLAGHQWGNTAAKTSLSKLVLKKITFVSFLFSVSRATSKETFLEANKILILRKTHLT